MRRPSISTHPSSWPSASRSQTRRFSTLLLQQRRENNTENQTSTTTTDEEAEIIRRDKKKIVTLILDRFSSPVIDDPYLPLSDVLVAQIVAPSLQIAWITVRQAPSPSWLQPIFDTNLLYTPRGSFLAPTLIHGAALATCWVVGALAAKAYQQDAIAPGLVVISENKDDGDDDGNSQSTTQASRRDYTTVLIRVLQAGAFATGLLILATQLDLWLEFEGRYVQPGDSPETDFRLLVAAVELVQDVFFEAVCLLAWRLYVASQSPPYQPSSSSR